MTNETKMVFDHSILDSKNLCIQFLREFGVARDWARVNMSEMRKMLLAYPDEKMFHAARAIVEREGDTYDREDFECEADEVEKIETVDVKAAPPTKAKVDEVHADANRAKVAAIKAAHHADEVPDVTEVASMLARLMASGKQAVDVDQVKAIALRVASEVATDSQADVLMKVTGMIDNAVKGIAPRELLIKTERSDIKISGLQHFMFETLLRTCSAVQPDGHRLNVWLYGPPGTGKTTAAKNAALALNLPFYCTGALLTKYDITGFIDANGKLIRSPFREAWENGGVYLFDEIDGSSPAAVVAFNAALANGIMAFPDGMIERHPDCVIIAAANTTGMGATAEFNGRMKIDMATIDRFIMLEWAIDEKIESALSSNPEWARIVQRVRANVASRGIKGVCITPRATIAGCALLSAGVSLEQVKNSVLRKAMSLEQWNLVAA